MLSLPPRFCVSYERAKVGQLKFLLETIITEIDYPYHIEVLDVPVVQVNVWFGMSLENKKKIVE